MAGQPQIIADVGGSAQSGEIESPLRAQFMLKKLCHETPATFHCPLLDRASMLECEGIRDDLFAFVSQTTVL
jgi:hypothetical protein